MTDPSDPEADALEGRTCDDPAPREAMRKVRVQELEELHCQHLRTGNPLYVWQAVQHCHHSHYQMPYPDWVRKYLHEVAVDLLVLGRLLDPRTYPERRADESESAHRTRFDDWRSRPILPGLAATLTAMALKLTRKGWNAFQRFQADGAARSNALDMDLAPSGAKRAVLEGILASEGLTEERSARRRITKGRELLGKRATLRQVSKPPP